MFDQVVDLMAHRFPRNQNLTRGLSVFLFIFMFLPTFIVLLAVVIFFFFVYPRLRKSSIIQRLDDS